MSQRGSSGWEVIGLASVVTMMTLGGYSLIALSVEAGSGTADSIGGLGTSAWAVVAAVGVLGCLGTWTDSGSLVLPAAAAATTGAFRVFGLLVEATVVLVSSGRLGSGPCAEKDDFRAANPVYCGLLSGMAIFALLLATALTAAVAKSVIALHQVIADKKKPTTVAAV